MSADWFDQIVQEMDHEQAVQIIEGMGDEQINAIIDVIYHQYIVPHLVEVRQRVIEDYPASETVRSQIEALSEQEKEDLFYEELDDLVAVLALLREDKMGGLRAIKEKLRDPTTMEALLLIAEEEDHITDEYSDQLKDFMAWHVRWIGVFLLSEAYSQKEIREVTKMFDLDVSDLPEDMRPDGT